MPSLTLKGVPPALHRRLKERAARHRRSINREAIECLESVLLAERVDVDALLADARRLRRRARRPTTDAEILELKKSGRP